MFVTFMRMLREAARVLAEDCLFVKAVRVSESEYMRPWDFL